jgi:hypothetical protein
MHRGMQHEGKTQPRASVQQIGHQVTLLYTDIPNPSFFEEAHHH